QSLLRTWNLFFSTSLSVVISSKKKACSICCSATASLS
ncbi:glutamine amidotransferase domain protein, partial [Vibrio parahaemolyticus V-223/04]